MDFLSKYTLTSDWESSSGGQTAFATRGGKAYFIKEYSSPKCPNLEQVKKGVLTRKTYDKNKAKFDRFYEMRSTINERLRALTGEGGNIICPLDWGVSNGKFVEATEFVPDILSGEKSDVKKKILSLSTEEKAMILRTAVAALSSVHKNGIIHGDIKFTNIVIAKNSLKNYVGKLIDFDCGFLETIKPNAVGGDQVYMSPELCECHISEMNPDYIEKLDPKTDIFSLGILFHEYLTGTLPPTATLPEELAGKEDFYYCEYILFGGEPQVSPKIKNPRMKALILNMLQLDPTKRPTAKEVLQELKEIDKPGSAGSEKEPFKPVKTFDEPWEEHRIEFIRSEIDRQKFVGCKRVEASGKKLYEFYRESTKNCFTKEAVISRGLAKPLGGGGAPSFDEPWPEHGIEFVPEKISAMKFVSLKQVEVLGKKAYEFYRANGTKKIYTKENALMSGLAKATGAVPPPPPEPKPVPTDFNDTPWEEHGIEFVPEKIAAMKFVGFKCVEVFGKKAYEFYRANGTKKFYTKELALMSGLAREK